MNILVINQFERKGGAAVIANSLHNGFVQNGEHSTYLVSQLAASDSQAVQIPQQKKHNDIRKGLEKRLTSLPKFSNKIQTLEKIGLQLLLNPWEVLSYLSGRENHHHSGVNNWLAYNDAKFDIIHLHNLHQNYFDLRLLQKLSVEMPIVITLHDTWLFTGHCGYFMDCSRWKNGCGNCPDLNRYPAIRRDATHRNWLVKKNIFYRSNIYLTTPSQWILNEAQQSLLQPAIRKPRVIRNGIDLSVFKEKDKNEVRRRLQLPRDAKIVLFVANGIRTNVYKDYSSFEKAFQWFITHWNEDEEIIFVGLGADSDLPESRGKVSMRTITTINDPDLISDYYNAADIYFHPARSDNFPTTILEAMACGLPVIASNVGGIPEQVLHGESGLLVPQGDVQEMVLAIKTILSDEKMRIQMGEKAACLAKQHYNRGDMITNYLKYFKEIQQDWISKY